MAEKKKTTPGRQYVPLFGKENYRWMIIGMVVITLGIILMIGGKSDDPNKFDPKQVYSFTRITVAPILILAGLALEIVAIFKKPKNSNS
ncbi:MAG: DUF3098 domain-containing protein [Bacteroidetes bacterium]|nr:MAG: DUF3098 domain-containing protein [Bacteroidota bacterium]